MINHSVRRDGPEFDGYYGSVRTPLLDLLGARRPTAALEIGCGRGANLGELKRRFPDCRTTGVELRGDVAQLPATRGAVDAMHIGDVLDPDAIDFAPGSFDLLLLSHVLEHFAEPERVIARALPWLTPDGRVLIALPNIRHLSVLRELVLHGDFEYRNAGILDRTHLRFYTRRSAQRFIAAQGLEIEATRADVNGSKSRWLDRATFGLASDFTAFAFNFLARKG